jgi:soluble lytic murein transglycosylase
MIFLGSRPALAWDAELYCSMPEMAPLGSLESLEEDEGGAMCAEHVPHAVRGPSFEVSSGGVSGRDNDEDVPAIAGRALSRARELAAAGLYDDALLNLRVVEATMPRIADHLALLRAELNLEAADPVRAARAFRSVFGSSSLDLAARAAVGYVESLLLAQDPAAPRELELLLMRYPALPEAPELRFLLAQYRERAKQVPVAIAAYRTIDLTLPGYPVAERARQRLSALAALGYRPAAYTQIEQLARAERLLRSGPMELAQSTLHELLAARLPKPLATRRDALLASLLSKLPKPDPSETSSELVPLIPEYKPEAKLLPGFKPEPSREEVEQRLVQASLPSKVGKLRPPQLFALLEDAGAARLGSVSDVLLAEITRRSKTIGAEPRFDALVIGIGSASDSTLIALADTLVDHPSFGVAARYHRARCLERLGDVDAARSELTRVVGDDFSPTRFYAHFANQRLRSLDGPGAGCEGAGRQVDCNRAGIQRVLEKLEAQPPADLEAATAKLHELDVVYGAAYPWLSRAIDLIKLGEIAAASDELHEAYLAWRWAAHRGPLRAGRVAIYRGKSVVVPPRDMATLRARLALDQEARNQLAQIASALGDVGTAVEFGGTQYAESHPMPYADEVARVARKYNLDPDLLFAVMRVESVYQRRIISHAGAIGLMQIMPRTGRLIADKLGMRETCASDLLDPRYNLELSGWYFSSLLERMDGHLPLAIASYNGGPHNVRRWIREYGDHIPLDAFLERIPFRETKRYVRRVLGYYAEYKALRGQSVDLMAMSLPRDKPTGVSF